jgi:hypothetical protein
VSIPSRRKMWATVRLVRVNMTPVGVVFRCVICVPIRLTSESYASAMSLSVAFAVVR